MESLLRGGLGFSGGREMLREDSCGFAWPTSSLSADMHPASQFALAAAYHDIKLRLAGLERENNSIKRKLKTYEVKFPMVSEFGERSDCCSCDLKEAKIIKADGNSSLQQKINTLNQELQKTKAHEEHLQEVIKAYGKIHLEKSNVQKDLDNMTTLAEQHAKKIRELEAALRHRDALFQKKGSRLGSGRESSHLCNKDTHYLHLHTSLDVPSALECPGPTLQSSRSLDTLTDLKVQRLEAELEGARHEARGACQREEELKAELQDLQKEIRHLQEKQRQQDMEPPCEHCNVEWIKKAGDEQVNLALAYTELTEELSRIQTLVTEQSLILGQKSNPAELNSSVLRHSPTFPRTSSPLSPSAGSTSYPGRRLRARFQGRRSYSEMTSVPSAHQESPRRVRHPVSTLPKLRPMGDGYLRRQEHAQATSFGPRPASAHGGSLSSSPHRTLRLGFSLADVHHLCTPDHLPDPTPLVTPPQSSEDEEEEWLCPIPAHSPPRTLGVMPPHPPFPAPDGPSTLVCCPVPGYLSSEHAQSWPSIKLWMESEESDSRSCPLCQMTFPTGYPDDALIKHIDTHLENSKI